MKCAFDYLFLLLLELPCSCLFIFFIKPCLFLFVLGHWSVSVPHLLGITPRILIYLRLKSWVEGFRVFFACGLLHLITNALQFLLLSCQQFAETFVDRGLICFLCHFFTLRVHAGFWMDRFVSHTVALEIHQFLTLLPDSGIIEQSVDCLFDFKFWVSRQLGGCIVAAADTRWGVVAL